MAADKDTELGSLIDRQIAETGPMPFGLYMQLCLTHPVHGYYHRKGPIGRGGDFVTAPEISQIFGESIGVWVALAGRELGGRFDLVELGPGRGTLMADLWRSLSRVAPEAQPGGPVLIEISDSLKAEQARALAGLSPRWHKSVADLPDAGPPLVIIANEFFDALPVRQYQKTDSGWHERVIGLDGDKRIWGLNPTPIAGTAMPAAIQSAGIDARYETRPAAEALMTHLAEKLTRRGGVLLAIDYGYAKTQTGDTIQAVAGHAFADPLARPGTADLTAHVDFEALARTATDNGLVAFSILTQGGFLAALGAAERAKVLARANPDQADAITADLSRLAAPDQMGDIFKLLCVSSAGVSPYPFETPLHGS